jgi:hypothetical protein
MGCTPYRKIRVALTRETDVSRVDGRETDLAGRASWVS